MDDLSFLVQETLRVNELRQLGEWEEEDGEEVWEPTIVEAPAAVVAPEKPGVLYHLIHQSGTFIVRSLACENMAHDFQKISENPEEFPSLRLVDSNGAQLKRLAWFATESKEEAEVIHSRIGHRRFPLREEEVCNLSDPGFSWWIEPNENGFVLHSKMAVLKEGLTRLGPIADAQVAPHRWSELTEALSHLPLEVNLSLENSRFIMSASKNNWVIEEFGRIFTHGVVSEDLYDLFRLMSKRGVSASTLESSWFFLKELAVVRRFWKEIMQSLD